MVLSEDKYTYIFFFSKKLNRKRIKNRRNFNCPGGHTKLFWKENQI